MVAYADAKGPIVIDDPDGTAGVMLPSVIGFDPDTGEPVVGRQARDHAVERPTTTVYSVKRLMGLGFADVAEEAARLPYEPPHRLIFS